MNCRRILGVFLVWCLLGSHAWAAMVSFDPSSQSVLNGSSVSVDLVADLPNPVLGWGLDVSFDNSLLSLTKVEIGPLWNPGFAPDGDGLAGLAFPFPISGNNIPLAKLTFDALAIGSSSLDAGITPLDLTEGFPLSAGGFDTVSFTSGSVEVIENNPTPVPAPSTFLLLGSGLIMLCGWKYYYRSWS